MGNFFEDLFEDLFESDFIRDVGRYLEEVYTPRTREAREVKRGLDREAIAIVRGAEEDVDLLRIRARRAAAAQRARIGGAGVSGSPLLVVQETLLLAFDEQLRLTTAAAEKSAALRRRGRKQISAARTAELTETATQIGATLLVS